MKKIFSSELNILLIVKNLELPIPPILYMEKNGDMVESNQRDPEKLKRSEETQIKGEIDFLENNNKINLLGWPSYSFNLNLTKNVWKML